MTIDAQAATLEPEAERVADIVNLRSARARSSGSTGTASFGPLRRWSVVGAVWLGAAALGCGGTPTPVPSVVQVEAPTPRPPPVDPCHAIAGDVETLAAAPGATCLTVGGGEVYWAGEGTIRAMPARGGAARDVAKLEGVEPVEKLISVRDRLFVLQGGSSPGAASCPGRIASIPRGGGAAITLAEGCIRDFAVGLDRLVYVEETRFDRELAHSTLVSIRHDSGARRVLFHRIPSTPAVVTDGRDAVLSLAPEALHRIPMNSDEAQLVFSGSPSGQAEDRARLWQRGVAADRDAYYFLAGLAYEAAGLHAYRLDRREGSAPRDLGRLFVGTPQAGGGRLPRGGLIQTATHIYWAAKPSGEVLRVAKSGACEPEVIATLRVQPDFVSPLEGHVVWLEGPPEARSIARRVLER